MADYFTNHYFFIYTVRNMKDSVKDRNDTNRIFPSLSSMDASILQCTRMGFPNPLTLSMLKEINFPQYLRKVRHHKKYTVPENRTYLQLNC